MLSKAEDVGVPENLLEQRQLSVGVLPVPVEKVHGEETLQALGLKTKLEGFHEQDKTSPVVDAKASVVQLVDDLLPVQCGLQLMHRLDEHLGKKGIYKISNQHLNSFILPPRSTSSRWVCPSLPSLHQR